MGLKTGLVAHWKMEEASNASRLDSSGLGNTLADVNSNVAQAAGMLGYCAAFDGATAAGLTCADNANISMGDIDFSIAAWVKPHVLNAAYHSIAEKGTGAAATSEYLFRIDDGNKFRLTLNVGTSETSAVSTTALSIDTWYYVVGWYDSAADRINITVNNGAEDQSGAWAGGAADRANSLYVGSENGVDVAKFNGWIDELSIWKRILTAAERTTLYNGGGGLTFGGWAVGSQVIWF